MSGRQLTRWVVLAALWIAGGAPTIAAAPAFEGEAALLAEVTAKTVGLAQWCQTSALLAERDRLARVLIHLDPNHDQARKWLKHRRAKDGSWEPDPAAKLSKDANPKAKAALPEQRRTTYGETLRTVAERASSLTAPEQADARSRLVELLVDLDPETAAHREANGEQRQGTGWLLGETLRARERRRELSTLATKVLGEVGAPGPAEVTETAQGFSLPWTRRVRTPHVLVLTTGNDGEADRVARYVEAALRLTIRLVAPDASLPSDVLVVCLLSNADEKKKVLDGLQLPKTTREFYERMLTFPAGNQHLVVSPADEAGRLEACARQGVDLVLRAGLGFDEKAPWIRDGVGTYVTWLLTGTRLTFLTQLSRYAEKDNDPKDRAERKEPNWLLAARRLDEAGRLPAMAWIAGLDLAHLAREDTLLAYVAAAWLLEGQGEHATSFLRRAAQGDPLTDVAAEVFALDLGVLDRRVRRWLEETT
jgi:hypothetical protein